ncbi:MAG: hypothetical protein Q9180_007821 [Flavoplaca navasiana]
MEKKVNTNKKLCGQAVIRLARATTQAQVTRQEAELRKQGGQVAIDYLNTFTRSEFIMKDFPGMRWGHVTSTIAESNNSWLNDIREDSTLQILDSIWVMVAEQRRVRKRAAYLYQIGDPENNFAGRKGIQALTSFAEQMLSRNLTFAYRCDVVVTTQTYDVVEARVAHPQAANARFAADARRIHITRFTPPPPAHYSAQYKQDFSEITKRATADIYTNTGLPYYCSCRRWFDMGFPCAHGLAAMRKCKIDANTMIGFNTWRLIDLSMTYDEPMHLVSTDDLEEDETILPPLRSKKPGKRRQKRMIPGQSYNPVSRDLHPQGCSSCGEGGHNITTCRYKEVDIFQIMMENN